MGLYFGETELTGLYFGDIELTGLYFGDIEIWAAWATYDGTLPAQYSANGSMLADYRIYGAAGGVGDRTVNLFNKNAKDTANGYENRKVLQPNGTSPAVSGQENYFITEYTEIPNDASYLTVVRNSASNVTGICFYDVNKEYISGRSNRSDISPVIVSCPTGAVYYRSSIYKPHIDVAMVVEGSTAPAEYVPYGYEVDMSVRSANLCPDMTVLSSTYSSTISTGNLFNALKNIKPDITHRISWSYESNGSGGVTNQIRLYTPGAVLVKLINNGSAFSLTSEEITAFTTIVAYFGTSNTNGKMSNFMLNYGSTPLPYQPYSNVTTPICIGSDSLDADEYADYKAGKIYRTTKNIMPSAAAGSATDHGVTVTCDGNSTYQISGRANGNAVIRFDLREFTIPAALDNGGNGVISVSYPRDPDVTIYLLDGNNVVYTINPYYGNVYTDYGIGLTIDGIAFAIADGQYADEFPFIIMITNDGTVPSVIDDYVPHLTPTDPPVPLPQLPTCEGVTITDYAGAGATASNNVLPSSTAQTQTSGNLSVTCDGEGRYHINKTGNGDLYVYFDIPEFTIPISKQGGGNGTVSFFNTMNTSAMVIFMNGSSSVDSWQMNSRNRQTDGYGTMAGKTINRIGFNCWGGSWTGDINIMFTDNGVLPSAFEPPSHALPKPSRFYAKYKKG